MTPEDANRRFRSLRAMVGYVRGPKFMLDPDTILRIDHVRLELLAAIARNAGPGPEHDGFPSGHEGSGGEYAPKGPTEAAVLAGYRLERGVHPEYAHGQWVEPFDAHDKLTREACEALEQLDQAWTTLLRRLEAIRSNSKKFKHDNPGGPCDHCGRWVEGTSNDRLQRGMCPEHYMAWYRAGKPAVTWVRQANGDERLVWERPA